ncbi:hypothetical protein OAQ99_02095 [Candidatus Kapabacteria bacterium]|nr:hypothetical protein [Candidatus Kapabacteria bacterium]
MKLKHQKSLNIKLKIPGSKSYFQRVVLLIYLLKQNKIVLQNVGLSNDDKTVIKFLINNSFNVDYESNTLIMNRVGEAQSFKNDVGESGFLTRSLLGILSLENNKYQIVGKGSLLKRSFNHELSFLRKNGVEVSEDSYLPISIKGPLKKKNINYDSSNSSQFLSGLLLGLSIQLYKDTIAVSNLSSKKYIDLTIEVAKKFGYIISHSNYTEFSFSTSNIKTPQQLFIESDWSSAAFWIVAGVISAEELILKGLNPNSSQADKKILDVLDTINISYNLDAESLIIKKQKLIGFQFDATDCPDLIPILCLLAVNCEGETRISGISRLINKESNRKSVLIKEFQNLGVLITEKDNTFIIANQKLNSGKVSSYNDHRIAMTFTIATITNRVEIEIDDLKCISKSYPDFLNHYIESGGEIN